MIHYMVADGTAGVPRMSSPLSAVLCSSRSCCFAVRGRRVVARPLLHDPGDRPHALPHRADPCGARRRCRRRRADLAAQRCGARRAASAVTVGRRVGVALGARPQSPSSCLRSQPPSEAARSSFNRRRGPAALTDDAAAARRRPSSAIISRPFSRRFSICAPTTRAYETTSRGRSASSTREPARVSRPPHRRPCARDAQSARRAPDFRAAAAGPLGRWRVPRASSADVVLSELDRVALSDERSPALRAEPECFVRGQHARGGARDRRTAAAGARREQADRGRPRRRGAVASHHRRTSRSCAKW